MDEHQIALFFEKTQEAFRFLEQEYGYRHLDSLIKNPEYVRDTSAAQRYLGTRIGIEIWWYFADAGIGVTFVEMTQPDVFPLAASLFPTTREVAQAINLTSLVEMHGTLDSPDFLLKDLDDYRKHKYRLKLIETRMPEIIEGLARATRTYAVPILEGDTSMFPAVMNAYLAQTKKRHPNAFIPDVKELDEQS